MKSGVYAIINTSNGKRYVGSAVHFSKRFIKHRHELNTNCHHSSKLQRAWIKYGKDTFVFVILFCCEKKDLLFYEQRAIDGFDAWASGYNMTATAGSRLGMTNSPEHRANISKSLTGRVMSAEWRANIGAGQKGKKRGPYPPERGAAISKAKKEQLSHHSDETKKRLSEAGMGNSNAKGRTVSPETRFRLAAAKIGKKQPPEQVTKRLATQAANRARKLAMLPPPPPKLPSPPATPWNKNMIMSAEFCAKLSEAHKGQVISVATRAQISAKLKGRVKTAEHLANLGKANKGKVLTPEHRAKLSAAKLGKKQSAEWVAARLAGKAKKRTSEGAPVE